MGLERDSAGCVCGNINGRSRLVLVVLLSVTILFGLFLFAAVSIQPGYASFPGVNGKIVFFSDRDGNAEIYVMNADGSSQTNLTNNPAADDEFPAWSPDGSKIAFTSRRDGNAEIYVMNADGSSQTRLTNNPAADYLPAWSPDGSKIAFASSRDGNAEIYVMNADGSSQTRLTNNGALDWSPDWQPLRALRPPVGGLLVSENKLTILLPYLALVGLVGVASTIFTISRRRRKA